MAIRAIEERRAERERLIELARRYTERLAGRVDLVAASIAGSVARGDFNVWSDVDVVVVAAELRARAPERASLLLQDAPPRIQPIGYTEGELAREWRRRNPLVREAMERGVVLRGEEIIASLGEHQSRLGDDH